MGIAEFNPRNNRVENVSRLSKIFRSNKRYVELVKGMPRTVVAVKTLKGNFKEGGVRERQKRILKTLDCRKNLTPLTSVTISCRFL